MPDVSSETAESKTDGPRYQPLVIVLVAACAGIVADRLLGLPLVVWWPATLIAWLVWLIFRRLGRDRTAAVVLLSAVASCAAAWHHCRWSLFADDDLGTYARAVAQPACVEAIAVTGPRRLPAPEFNLMHIMPIGDRSRLEVEAIRLRDGARWRAVSGRARLNVDGHLLGVRAGDRLLIFAQLTAPRAAHNPGEFDYAAHARRRRQRGQLNASHPDCVTVLERAGSWNPQRWIENLRSGGDKLLWKHLDHRRSGLAAAVLLGAREALGYERPQAFVQTGTVHLLAISGLHVGIVAGAVLLLMRLACAPRSQALLATAAVTVLYTLLSDARPPAVRAAILVLVLCAGHYLGRPRPGFNSLAAAGLVVLVLNPADLFQTGAQLSFLAVAGLMWFAPRWFGSARQRPDALDRLLIESRPWLWRALWPVWRGARHLTLVSALIWLLALPLVMARFHLFTPVAVVLNTILWLPMAAALVAGFGVLAFGWLVPPLAGVFGFCCDVPLWLLEWCIGWARRWPGSHFWVPGPADWWLVGFYGGLGVLAAFPALRPTRRWCLVLLAGWTAVGVAAHFARHQPGNLDCTFLSVGHGAAVVIELPSGGTMLYDAGQFASPDFGAQSIAAALWSRGITRLDAVVLSHADVDHYNTLPELLERFSVGVIRVSPVMFDKQGAAVVALQDAIRRAEVPLEEIRAGDRLIADDGCLIQVLHPSSRGAFENDNANSIVLAVEHLGRRILLPGDLESPGLEDVTAEPPWDCDVLLAPHHGSRGSDPPGLAAWCTPEWVVISGSLRADFHQTAATYRQAGAQVLHTGRDGAVHVTIDAAGVHVESFLSPR